MAGATSADDITLSVCTICLEDYSEPRVLPCLHTYCSDCLKEYIASKLHHIKETHSFECPTCRKSIRCASVSDLDVSVRQFPIDTCMNVLVNLEKQLKHLMEDGIETNKFNSTSEYSSKSLVKKKEELNVRREKSLVCAQKNNTQYIYMCPNEDLYTKKVLSVFIEIQKKILPFLKEALLFTTPQNIDRKMFKTRRRNMSTNTEEQEDSHMKSMRSAVMELSISPTVRSYRGWNYRGLLYTPAGHYIIINIRCKCLILYDKERELHRLVLAHEPYGMCWCGNNQIALTASYQKLYIIKLLPTNRFDLAHVFRTSIQYSGIDFYSDAHLIGIGYAEPHLKLIGLTYESTIELTILMLPFHRLKGHKCVHITSKEDIYIADTSNGIVYCFKPYIGWTSYNILQPTDIVSLGKDVYISQGFGIDKILRLDSRTDKLSCFLSPKDGLVCPCSMVTTNQKGIILACDNEGDLKIGFWDEL